MGLFKRRKKKKPIAKKEINSEVIQEQKTEKPDFTDKRQVQHFVLECCEQMLEAIKEIGEEKSEYRIVTEYLNDIQTLEELSEGERGELKEAAENVRKLDCLRDELKNSERHISDAQFNQIQQEEDAIPDGIRRLQTNEAYQATVKKDMNYLEGEKTEWHYAGIELVREQKILKNLSFVLFGVFFASMVLILILRFSFRMDITYAWMAVVFLGAICGFGIFLKMSSNQTEIKRAEVNQNHAIELLNKVKFKYINITNAVDYAREKYHVKNSYELNYIWEQYLNEVKEREKFNQMNEELEYFSEKLVYLLHRYRLHDSQVWVNQSSALIDKKEMVEVKHNLIVRRQKLRSRIDYNTQNIVERKNEIEQLLRKENIYTPEVREIINSIDRLSGIG